MGIPDEFGGSNVFYGMFGYFALFGKIFIAEWGLEARATGGEPVPFYRYGHVL
jgi:hypothetical protein